MQNQSFKYMFPLDKLIIKNLCKEKIKKGMKNQEVVISMLDELEKLPWIKLDYYDLRSIAARVRHRLMKK